MRSRFLPPMLTLIAVLAVGVIWQRERAAAQALQDRLALLARQEKALAQLQTERERLRREIKATPIQAPVEPAAPASAPAESPVPPAWTVGEWTPAPAWRNAGRATPRATASTLLWAAANGDVAKVGEIFQFGDDTRAKARAWFDSLPAGVRSVHATPEDLVAGVTLAHIAPDRAQLSWLHEDDGDRAIVGLLVAGPPAASTPPRPTGQAAQNNLPPALADRAHYKIVVLNLRRTPDGWRVRVPAEAIDNLARNLRAPEVK